MDHLVYGFPDVGRAGLGNLLLPWARCEAFCHPRGYPILAPQWTQPKIGPLLRGERDKRYYIGLFRHDGYVSGISRLRILLTGKRVDELSFNDHSTAVPKRTVVRFSGLAGMFDPILPHRDLIVRRLDEILSDRVRTILKQHPVDFVIGAHIRRGDKPVLAPGEPQTNPCTGMPESWYVECIRRLRRALGFDAAVRVFTDGRPSELRSVLALPNVRLAVDNPSIVDMLLLSKSRVLLTSAGSTFSMWASYLGRMPSLWYPGGLAVLNPDRPKLESEADFSGTFSDEFAQLAIKNV